MKNFLVMFFIINLVSCGKNGKNGTNGADGVTIAGVNSTPVAIDFEDISPGLSCQNGGISVFTFKDENLNALFDEGEVILKIKAICNGLNGTDGSNSTVTLESIISSDQCPQGGIRLSSNTSEPVVVCNGVNGLNGEQGIQGVQGIPGIAGKDGQDGKNGADGTKVIPVKFCTNDKSTFPEYGLVIGDELFAVYWGTTPASPSKPQAFLTKLVAGNYMSTGGNNCLFSVQ